MLYLFDSIHSKIEGVYEILGLREYSGDILTLLRRTFEYRSKNERNYKIDIGELKWRLGN